VRFWHSRIFIATVLVQTLGLFFFGLNDWANVIQCLSGFGMAYAVWEYVNVHKREIEQLKQCIEHLHEKHDESHRAVKGEGRYR
jgi:hypothetical protein